jgi:uncharacterized repeat protein (TIGR01451 family)
MTNRMPARLLLAVGAVALLASQFGLGTAHADSPSTDLSVTKTGPATVRPGADLSYHIVWTNNGPDDASNVAVTDTLPAGETLKTATFDPTSLFSACSLGGTISCNTTSMPAGSSIGITLTVTVSGSLSDGTVLNNTATVSSSSSIDPTPSNNTSTASTTVTNPTVAVTFGDAKVEASTDNDHPGQGGEAFRYISPGTGTISKLSLFVAAGTTATSVQLGIYDNNNGDPGHLLGAGTLAAPQPNAWNDVSLPTVSLNSGQVVWVAVLAVGGTLNFRDRCCGGGGTVPSETNGVTTLTALPSVWTPGIRYHDGPMSVFGTLQAVLPISLLGQPLVQSQVDFDVAGSAEAFRTTAGASGTIGTLDLYLDPSSGASTVIVGVYGDANGQPGQRLAEATIAAPVAGAWNSVTLPPTAVTSGTPYWIAILSPAGAGVVRFEDDVGIGTSPSQRSAQSTLTDLPATWSPGATYPKDGPLSAYGAP